MSTALAVRSTTFQDPDLVAWHEPAGLTPWHISAGAVTRCGQRIPPPGQRYTRRHHPSSIVCRQCVDGQSGIAVADVTPRVLDLMAALKQSLKQNPVTGETVTGRGADAVEPGAGANLDPAREGSNA